MHQKGLLAADNYSRILCNGCEPLARNDSGMNTSSLKFTFSLEVLLGRIGNVIKSVVICWK